MPNIWSKQAYDQGFDCEPILLKKLVNMFEQMNIAEYIHEGVVETYYKNPTRADANRSGHSGQERGEATSSQTHPVMDEIAGKHRKGYVDCLSSESKTCLIHSPGHSHDE